MVTDVVNVPDVGVNEVGVVGGEFCTVFVTEEVVDCELLSVAVTVQLMI